MSTTSKSRRSRPQLHRLIRARRWDEVTSHLERNGPEDATVRDGTGTNALHLACGRDPPLDVVEALMIAHPSGTSEQDSVGSTPLTVACQQHRLCSVGVIRALLQHDPRSARRRDAWGGSAMDAVYSGVGFTAARGRILQRGAGDGDDGGGERTSSSTDEGSTTTTAMTTAEDEDFRDGWEKLCLILAADYHGSVSSVSVSESSSPGGGGGGGGGGEKTWRVVHACAGARYAPCLPGLLRLAVALHPEQVCEVDENGRLPLHILLSNLTRLTTVKPDDMIELLVGRYPAAAGVPDGTSGRLPLHAAVAERGGAWLWTEGGVGSIYRAAPYAVRVRDVDTGLFPFMLAAVGGYGFCCVDTIFELLRAFPELRAFSRGESDS